MPVFRHRTRLAHAPEAVFRWHASRGAFQRLVPPWLDVRILEGGGELEEGAPVRLRVRRGGWTFRWTLVRRDVEEGRLFRDEQLSGPFGVWNHVHRFLPDGEGGCVVEDELFWEPPIGVVGAALRPWIEGELGRLFSFRARRLAGDLGRLLPRPSEPRTIAVTGASGLLGSSLTHFLTAAGHRVRPLVRSRSASGAKEIYWSVSRGEIDAEALEGVDAVVHLAGESLFGLRWTPAKRKAILESRRKGTRLLSRTLAALRRPPRVMVSASGVHFYGGRGEEVLTEASAPGAGFLADVCREWEDATEPARAADIRVVHLRSGMVLTPAGGALSKMLLPFRLGLGGTVGNGRQRWSWIDADDEVGLIHHALVRDELVGPVNATAPESLTNAQFTRTLGRVLRRPTPCPVPAVLVEVALGQMGRELLLLGQRARPERALSTGFRFEYPELEGCLRHELGRSRRRFEDDDEQKRGGIG